jgi:hypothetical protein
MRRACCESKFRIAVRRRPVAMLLFLGVLAALSSQALVADSYHESSKWWFINTVAPNWTCADASLPCYASGPNAYSFNGLYIVRRNGFIYAYVQGGGNPGPCSTMLGGDNFCVFRAPDTAPGWTGNQDLTVVNHRPRDDDGWFWQVRSAFYDASMGNNVYVVASRTISGSTSAIDVMDAKLGTSMDGVHFNWSTLMTSNRSELGVRLEDYSLVPHPTQPKVWIGTIGWFDTNNQPFITPWKVDWTTSKISIPDSAGTWRTLDVGGTLHFVPQVVALGRGTNVQVVNVGGVSRVEVWATAAKSYSRGSGIQNNPCAPGYPNGVATSRYTMNRVNPQQVGSTGLEFLALDPNTLTFTRPWTPVTSAVRALPSDYGLALAWMAFRFDTGLREYVYTGSKDNVICDYGLVNWNPWAGDGILVTKADYVP